MALSDDLLITPTLLRRFELESQFEEGDGRYYALMRRDNGQTITHQPPYAPDLMPDQMMFAQDVLKRLNRDIHHDGAWVIVFTHPKPPEMESVLHHIKDSDYARYALIWLDKDGDPQFTMDWMRGTTSELRDFSAVLLAGIDSLVAKAETSWQLWKTMMLDVLGPKAEQTYKRAQGQKPASVH